MCNCYSCQYKNALAAIGTTEAEVNEAQAIVNDIIALDQQTYINIVKGLEIFERIPSPMWTPQVLNAHDQLLQVLERYKNRQQTILDNSNSATPFLNGASDWLGNKFGSWFGIGSINGVPLVPIAIGAIFIFALGGLTVYFLSQQKAEAQFDVIESSEAWQTLKAAYPSETAQVESLVKQQLTKANAGSFFNGSTSFVKWLVIGGVGLFAFKHFKSN